MITPYKNWMPTLGDGCFVADTATLIGNVEIGPQSSVWFNAVVRGDVHEIRIGARTNIQDLSMLHVTHRLYGLTIGSDVTVGHRVVLHGCTVGDGCLIGIGAIVLDGAVIGPGAMVAAGSLVTPRTVIPSGMLAMGSPAKVVRPLSDAQKAQMQVNSAHYVQLAETYLQARAAAAAE